MPTVAESPASVNWQEKPNHIQQRALNTRTRRQAAGRYNRPSAAQQAAFAKTMQRDGRKNLSIEEMSALATHPYLTAAQRSEYATMAEVAFEKAAK